MENTWIQFLTTISEMAVLVKSLNLTPQTEAEFWKKMLETLKADLEWETGQSPLPHTDNGSLMGFITEYADIEKNEDKVGHEISNLYAYILHLIRSEESTYWNNSVQTLIEFIINNLLNINDDTVILPIEGENKSITIKILKESDAGYKFINEPDEDGTIWVKPWWNINGKSYNEERGCDEVNETLSNEDKLQFTREKVEEQRDEEISLTQWIRLLMPQYGRRVEIEDLNRNFWVIAQVIGAISNYLYDDDAPLPKALQGLTREITEIWENIPYLWANIAAITQKKSLGVKVIHMPLPPRINDHSRKYDKIGNENDSICSWHYDDGKIVIDSADDQHWNSLKLGIISRLKYLAQKYDGYSLCIVPYIRLNNYKHNYYGIEYYPGVFFYDYAYKDNEADGYGWRAIKLTSDGNGNPVVISLKDNTTADMDFANNVYGVRQNCNGQVAYCFPFSKGKDIIDSERIICYGALRTIAELDANLDSNDRVVITNDIFHLKVYDGQSSLINGTSNLLGYYQHSNGGRMSWVDNDSFVRPAEINTVQKKNYQPTHSGCYLGEVATWKFKTSKQTKVEQKFQSDAYVLKLGSYMPKTSQFQMVATSNEALTAMKGNITTTTGYSSTDGLKFYLNPWQYYTTDASGEETAGVYCYKNGQNNVNPIEYSCADVTDSFLKDEGLKAVKHFLKNSHRLSQPCYVITAIGLTPWDGAGNVIYWDIGGVCNIYHYIPSTAYLDPQPTDPATDGYTTEYNRFPVSDNYKITEPDPAHPGENIELGKIISCGNIKRYDSFFEMFDNTNTTHIDLLHPENTTTVYYNFLGQGWRQFNVKATISHENEYCNCIITNEGDPDVNRRYEAKFSTTFKGTVNYYDNRWAATRSPKITDFDDKAQVGIANVEIPNAGNYSQSGDGHIANASESQPDITLRTNLATANGSHGFMPAKNFTSIAVGDTESTLYDVFNSCSLQRPGWIYK